MHQNASRIKPAYVSDGHIKCDVFLVLVTLVKHFLQWVKKHPANRMCYTITFLFYPGFFFGRNS